MLDIYEAFFTAAENWESDEQNNSFILLLSLMIYPKNFPLIISSV